MRKWSYGTSVSAIVAATIMMSAPAMAQSVITFNIEPGSLDRVLTEIAAQSGHRGAQRIDQDQHARYGYSR